MRGKSNSSCCFCGRSRLKNSSSYEPGLHLFAFPSNVDKCYEWISSSTEFYELYNLQTYETCSSYRLCQHHFEKRHFKNSLHNSLNWNAVPTIFAGTETVLDKAQKADSGYAPFDDTLRNCRSLSPLATECITQRESDGSLYVKKNLQLIPSNETLKDAHLLEERLAEFVIFKKDKAQKADSGCAPFDDTLPNCRSLISPLTANYDTPMYKEKVQDHEQKVTDFETSVQNIQQELLMMNKVLMCRDTKLPRYSSCAANDQPPAHGRGLMNKGNTCYLNSCVQALLNMQQVKEAVSKIKITHKDPVNSNPCLFCEYLLLAKKCSQENSIGPVDPGNFVNRIPEISDFLVQGEMEDASHFFRALVLSLSRKTGSLFEEQFAFEMATAVCCERRECQNSEVTAITKYIDLTLPLTSSTSINKELHKLFFGLKPTDYRCNNCGCINTSIQTKKIINCPETFVIILQRETIGEKFETPEYLSLPNFLSSGNINYRLEAIVNYHQVVKHYTCNVRHSRNQWYRYNDSRVDAVLPNFCSGEETILFYRKTSDEIPPVDIITPKRNYGKAEEEKLTCPKIQQKRSYSEEWIYQNNNTPVKIKKTETLQLPPHSPKNTFKCTNACIDMVIDNGSSVKSCSNKSNCDSISTDNSPGLISFSSLNDSISPLSEALSMKSTSPEIHYSNNMKLSVDSSMLVKATKSLFANKSSEFIPSPKRKSGRKLTFKERFNARRILNRLNVRRKLDLPPEQNYLFDHVKILEKKCKILIMLLKKCQGQVNELKSKNDRMTVEDLEKSIAPSMVRIIQSNVKFGRKGTKAKGRRWSTQEKLDMIQLYKGSPRNYELLRSMIKLPCKRTLITIINKIEFRPGINNQIFDQMERCGREMLEIDKCVNIVFDETRIKRKLMVNRRRGLIDGYVDNGTFGRQNKIANQALIFMVHGIANNWTMPLEYTFADGTTSTEIIKELLVELIRKLRQSGYKVISCTSDQGSTNRGALGLLGATEDKPYFVVDNERVVCLYDPSHIIKRTRCGVKKHGLIVEGAKVEWEHIRSVKKLDNKNSFKRLKHIKAYHLDPKRKKLMKVILAVHIFSNTMAVEMFRYIKEGKLPITAGGTAHFLSVMNKVFDTLNSGDQKDYKSVYRNPMTDTSKHLKVWDKFTPWIKSWIFNDNLNRELPNKSAWIWTINGMKLIWTRMKDVGLKQLSTRNLSSDCIENLNGRIKACVNNPQPDATLFQAAFKKLMICSKPLPHSQYSNCEDDRGIQLTDLSALLYGNPEDAVDAESSSCSPEAMEDEETYNPTFDHCCNITIDELTNIDYQNGSVTARKILNRMLKTIDCEQCKSTMYIKCSSELSPGTRDFHKWVDHDKSSPTRSLFFPTIKFSRSFTKGAVLVDSLLPEVGFRKDLFRYLGTSLDEHVSLSWLGCDVHSETLRNVFKENVITYSCNTYCNNTNDFLETLDESEEGLYLENNN